VSTLAAVTAPEGVVSAPDAGRWRVRWTGRGWAVLALGAVMLPAGLVARYPGVAGLGAAFGLLAMLSLVAVRHRAPVTVRRSVWPLEVTRFGDCAATLRIRRNTGLFPMSLDAVEQVGDQEVAVRVPDLPPGRTTEVTYPVPTHRRGVLTIGPVLVRRRGPLGLAESTATLAGTAQVRVLPRVLPVQGMPSGIRRGHQGTDERVPHGGTDLVGLRDYIPGDDLRRIHWATSARAGQLMVREDADPSRAYLTVLLDDRASSYPEGDLEDAVEVAASLAVAAGEHGHGVRLLTVCDLVDIAIAESATGVSNSQAREVVSRLAEVEAQAGDREPGGLPISGLDIVVAVTGAEVQLGSLLAEASRASAGVVAIVDRQPGPHPGIAAVGPVMVLRGVDAPDVLRSWYTAMVS